MNMKPWYLYTAEDDEHLYDQDFDLEALLNPTPSRPGVQIHSTPDESPLVLTPLEGTAMQPQQLQQLQQLQQQLQQARAQITEQKKVIQDKDSELEKMNNALLKKEQQVKEQCRSHTEMRILYNTAVSKNSQLKQELTNTKRVLGEAQQKIKELDTAKPQRHNIIYSPIPSPLVPTPPEETALVMQLQQQLQQARAQLTDRKSVIREKDTELEEINNALLKKNQQVIEQSRAHTEMRLLYNTAVSNTAQLKQELTKTRRVLGETQKQEQSGYVPVKQNQDQRSQQRLSVTSKKKWASRHH